MPKNTIPVCYGYQGKNNIGDNLMFLINTAPYDQVFVKKGRKARPNDIELPLAQFIMKLITGSEVIFTGGNIFNVDSWKSKIKIVLFFLLVKLRQLLGKKTVFLSIGINKNTSPFVRGVALRTVMSASYAHLRETSIKTSAIWANNQAKHKHIAFKPDVVFDQDLAGIDQIQGFHDITFEDRSKPYAVFFPSIVARRETAEDMDDIAVPDDISEIVVIVQAEEDADIRPSFFEGKQINQIRSNVDNITQLLSLIIKADLIITERYHGAILAKRFDVPMVASNFSEKLRNIEMVT